MYYKIESGLCLIMLVYAISEDGGGKVGLAYKNIKCNKCFELPCNKLKKKPMLSSYWLELLDFETIKH